MKNYNADCILCREDIPHSHVTDEGFYPKVKPLTSEEIVKIYGEATKDNPMYSIENFARAIEKAHGIK